MNAIKKGLNCFWCSPNLACPSHTINTNLHHYMCRQGLYYTNFSLKNNFQCLNSLSHTRMLTSRKILDILTKINHFFKFTVFLPYSLGYWELRKGEIGKVFLYYDLKPLQHFKSQTKHTHTVRKITNATILCQNFNMQDFL